MALAAGLMAPVFHQMEKLGEKKPMKLSSELAPSWSPHLMLKNQVMALGISSVSLSLAMPV
jgi:hypothetical protein